VNYLYELLKTINNSYLKPENEINVKLENFESLELQNINFRYNEGKNIINNLNFKIEKDQIIGISGKSGSGKTTFVDIIVGFLKPSIGEIFLNKKKIDIERETYKELFFYLPQNRVIFDFDLETNITLTIDKKKIDYDFLNRLIKDCYLEDFILDEKNKEYKKLRYNANNISGGQQQRIILARAIYSRKEILILDESTNALDKELQSKIIRNIKKYFKNILIISHDIESISPLIDELYKFENGKISKV
jgi:ABC-type bacteriocin/lantibiotic exporter with double-glycine peptidase domain